MPKRIAGMINEDPDSIRIPNEPSQVFSQALLGTDEPNLSMGVLSIIEDTV